MMSLVTSTLLAICCSLWLVNSRISANTSQRLKQPEFIQLPKDLLQQLARDDRDVASFLQQGLGNDPMYSFTANPTDLNADGKVEYFIYPPASMDGNSSGPRWIYRRVGNGYQQILSTGSMNLDPLRTSTNDYRDIQSTGGGNSGGYFKDVFRFNGKKYVLAHRRTSKTGIPK